MAGSSPAMTVGGDGGARSRVGARSSVRTRWGVHGQEGTVLLFGHSSYLPIVHNQSYKAFDGIQNLKTGDIISVFSNNHEYRYSVVGVKLADASQDVIELPQTGKHLTLVTCDSFASKSNRFVVTADLVGTYTLASN